MNASLPTPTLVVALPGGEKFAPLLASSLRCDWHAISRHCFPDGETLVRYDVPLKGRTVVLACSLDHPDDKTLALLFAADAARELGATQVGLVAPYLAYMRQDIRFHPGEAVTSRSYAKLLSANFDWLVTADPFFFNDPATTEIYTLPTEVVASAPLIARWIGRHIQRPLLVGPDAESEQWVAEVARLCSAPCTVMTKTRRGDRHVGVRLRDAGPWTGHTPMLVDDIASTGHTLAEAARTLMGIGLPAPVCVVVHALFDAAAADLLHGAGVRRIASCDSISHPSNAIALAPLLAPAVRRLAQVAQASHKAGLARP